MNTREVRLLIVLLVILGGGGGAILVYQWFYKPLVDYNARIKSLNDEIETKQEKIDATLVERKLLDRARLMSLSPHADVALNEYAKYLYPLLVSCKLDIVDFSRAGAAELKAAAGPPGTTPLKPGHQVVAISVRARGELSSLVKALELIQRTPLVQRVKSLDIARVDTSPKKTTDKLNITMTLEALSVSKAATHIEGDIFAPDQRLVKTEVLLARFHGPQGMALLPWIVGPMGPFAQKQIEIEGGYRNYDEIAYKNIFNGLMPPRVAKESTEVPIEDPYVLPMLEYVLLDTTDPDGREAFFRNKIVKTRPIKVRSASWSGFNIFQVQSEYKTAVLLRAKVLRIDQRDVYFQVQEDVYCVHIGQTLAEAMRRPLFSRDLERLKLSSLYDADWGAAETALALKDTSKQKKKNKGGR